MNKTMTGSVADKGARAAARAKPDAPSAPVLAVRLLGRWTRIAQGHIGFDMGCSCCGEFGNVQVQDMEQHILDYLDTKYRACGVPQVPAFLAGRAGYRSGESGSIAELLRAVAAQSDVALALKDQLSLLDDLTRSIDSLDEVLSGRV